MPTTFDWHTGTAVHAYVSVDGEPILRLSFDETAVEWQTHLLTPASDDLVWESQAVIEVSAQEEIELRLQRPETVDVMSPGVTDALSAAWYARVRVYRDSSKQLAEWAAAVRARAYARQDVKPKLKVAYERLKRMDMAACQECNCPIDWFDPDEPFNCPICGYEQEKDPIRRCVDDLHPGL